MGGVRMTQQWNPRSIVSTLILLSIPTLLSNVLEGLNGFVNTLAVGRLLGKSALAATSSANLIMFFLFSVVFGFALSASVLVGQAVGRRDMAGAQRIAAGAVGICFLLSVIACFFGYIFCDNILTILQTPAEAFAQARIYLKGILVGIPANLLLITLMFLLRATGDAVTPLWFMVVNVACDIVLNPLLILGVGPFPTMGIAGSACSTIVAGVIASSGLIFYIYWRKLPLALHGKALYFLIPSRQLLFSLFFTGIATSLQMLVMSSSGLIMVSFVNREGLTCAAAYNVVQQVCTYLQMPAMAVGSAVSVLVAQQIGARVFKSAFFTTFMGLLLTGVLTGGLLALLLCFSESLFFFFVGHNGGVVSLAQHIQHIVGWSYLFFGLAMVIFSTLRANQQVWIPLLFLFAAVYPVRLGFYYLAYPRFGADAIWYSFLVGSFFAIVTAGLYYLLAQGATQAQEEGR